MDGHESNWNMGNRENFPYYTKVNESEPNLNGHFDKINWTVATFDIIIQSGRSSRMKMGSHHKFLSTILCR